MKGKLSIIGWLFHYTIPTWSVAPHRDNDCLIARIWKKNMKGVWVKQEMQPNNTILSLSRLNKEREGVLKTCTNNPIKAWYNSSDRKPTVINKWSLNPQSMPLVLSTWKYNVYKVHYKCQGRVVKPVAKERQSSVYERLRLKIYPNDSGFDGQEINNLRNYSWGSLCCACCFAEWVYKSLWPSPSRSTLQNNYSVHITSNMSSFRGARKSVSSWVKM